MDAVYALFAKIQAEAMVGLNHAWPPDFSGKTNPAIDRNKHKQAGQLFVQPARKLNRLLNDRSRYFSGAAGALVGTAGLSAGGVDIDSSFLQPTTSTKAAANSMNK